MRKAAIWVSDWTGFDSTQLYDATLASASVIDNKAEKHSIVIWGFVFAKDRKY